MGKINDLDLKNWKKYKDIKTDSLWIIEKRDKSETHRADYHGNFVPQIPNQLIRRYTKKNDTVLDTFLGSGTTQIEAKKLRRNSVGIELLPKIAGLAKKRIGNSKAGEKELFTKVIVEDSTSKKSRDKVEIILSKNKKKNVQLIIMHPPYHDIIKFSKNKNDLSNAKTTGHFLKLFSKVLENYLDLLEKGHFLAIVIGDKYEKGTWIPLGSLIVSDLQRFKNLNLKSIIVKNMAGNRAKRNMQNLWRYRAIAGGFYIFRHEYILIYEKIT